MEEPVRSDEELFRGGVRADFQLKTIPLPQTRNWYSKLQEACFTYLDRSNAACYFMDYVDSIMDNLDKIGEQKKEWENQIQQTRAELKQTQQELRNVRFSQEELKTLGQQATQLGQDLNTQLAAKTRELKDVNSELEKLKRDMIHQTETNFTKAREFAQQKQQLETMIGELQSQLAIIKEEKGDLETTAKDVAKTQKLVEEKQEALKGEVEYYKKLLANLMTQLGKVREKGDAVVSELRGQVKKAVVLKPKEKSPSPKEPKSEKSPKSHTKSRKSTRFAREQSKVKEGGESTEKLSKIEIKVNDTTMTDEAKKCKAELDALIVPYQKAISVINQAYFQAAEKIQKQIDSQLLDLQQFYTKMFQESENYCELYEKIKLGIPHLNYNIFRVGAKAIGGVGTVKGKELQTIWTEYEEMLQPKAKTKVKFIEKIPNPPASEQ